MKAICGITFIAVLLLLLASWFVNLPDSPSRNSVTSPVDTRLLKIGDSELEIEIADEPQEKIRGLSGRASLPENHGILFMFEEPGRHGFWMKNMKFAIDILWVDENFVVTGISPNLAPESFPAIFQPPEPIRYALEVNGGWAEAHGIKRGNRVTLSP